MLIYRNTTDSEVKLKLPPKEGEDIPSEVVVAAGADYEIDDDTAKFFLNYDLHATKVEGTAEAAPESTNEAVSEDSDKDEAKAEEPAEAPAEKSKEDKPAKVEEAKVSEADARMAKVAEAEAKLAEERRAFDAEKAEKKFEKYVAEGKATPAQKEAFMALSLNESAVCVREGKEEKVSDLLTTLFESAAPRSLYEEQGAEGEGEEEPELTSDEKEVAEVFGNSEEDIKAIKKERN